MVYKCNKRVYVLLLIVLSPLLSLAQQRITGKVFNSTDHTPVKNATVSVKNAVQGTTTNDQGEFSIAAGKGQTLVVSSVGYLTEEITIGTATLLNIELKSVEENLNSVVVVGYGTQKKVNLTGSVATLNMRDKENTPVTNASQALHGVSGLWVNQAGSKPGQDVANIRIRGVGTLNNNDPLVLVDGIEYNLNEIDPNFIESISVLKDAAAAIYGSRGANGVILITTKTGKKQKAEINYSYSYGIQKATYLPDVVWDPILYMQMKDQALINEGKAPGAVDYSPAQIDEYKNGMATDPYSYPNINWFDQVLKNGMLQQHNLRLSGGSDKVVYNIGLGYMDQDGILIAANHANRYTLNVNVQANLTDKLKISANIIGNYRTYTEPPFGSPSATNYYFTRLMRVLPIFTPYTADGRYGSSVFTTPGRNTIENPIMLLKEGSNDHRTERTLAKVSAEYTLPFNLVYNVNFAVDKEDGFAKWFVPYVVTYNPKTGVPNNYNIIPASNNYDANNLNLTLYQTLNWTKTFAERHKVSVIAGQSYNRYDVNNFQAHIEGYFDNTLTDLNAGSVNPSVSGSSTRDILLSYFGRLNYSFDDKYLLEGIVRADGSSRFAAGRRWGSFPSLSAGWRIDREDFFHSRIISLLKLRASWGKLGNQAVPLYSYLNTVNLGYDYTFNNAVVPGAAVAKYNDPTITWEKTTTYNGGVDISLWNGKLNASFDIFQKRTSDILRTVAIPQQVGGLSGPAKNVGSVDNKGYEIALGYQDAVGKFKYAINAQVSYVKNRVVNLNGETIIGTRRITKEGSPIDAYYLYQAEGIYQTQQEVDNSAHLSNAVKPGYIKYADLNKDGKITGDDRIITGSSIPKYNYGFSFNFSYEGLTLNAVFQGVQGISLYPTANLASPFNNGAGVTKNWVTDSWTPDNPNAKLPILTTATGATENYQPSTFWLKDGSYLRLKDLQLKYDLPAKWLHSITAKKISVFVNANNILTISKFKDFDPEKDITGDTYYEYPTLKTYSFGANVTF